LHCLRVEDLSSRLGSCHSQRPVADVTIGLLASSSRTCCDVSSSSWIDRSTLPVSNSNTWLSDWVTTWTDLKLPDMLSWLRRKPDSCGPAHSWDFAWRLFRHLYWAGLTWSGAGSALSFFPSWTLSTSGSIVCATTSAIESLGLLSRS
jgi:hypothetical protein